MAEWLVEVQGDRAELADQFDSARLSVRKEGESYYLRSSEDFDGLSDASDVCTRATELLLLLSGVGNLYAGAGETITPGVVIWQRDDGTRDRFQLGTATVRARSKVRLWGTEATDPTIGESWLSLARQDDNVLDTLRFFQEDTTWWSLRKAYEVIERDEFGQQSKVAKILSTPEEEIQRFKEWTQYYVHGGRRKRPDPDKFPPLLLVEADSFLRDLLKKWLRWKLDQQKLSERQGTKQSSSLTTSQKPG
jgi:hypothetical protein